MLLRVTAFEEKVNAFVNKVKRVGPTNEPTLTTTKPLVVSTAGTTTGPLVLYVVGQLRNTLATHVTL